MPELDAYLAKLTRAADDHALRHRPSGWGIALADSIAHVRESDWDEVVGPRFFMGRDYLRAIERARPPRMGFRYALCYEGTRPVAAASYQILDIALDAFGSRMPVQPGPDDSLRDVVRNVRRNVVRTLGDAVGESGARRLLINGNALVTGEHGLAFVAGVDPRRAVHGLADATYRIRRAEKLNGGCASVLIKDFGTDARVHADELTRFGYHAFAVDPNMAVDIDPSWRGFDDYLAAFTAKYRRKVKDARKRAKALRACRLGPADVVRHAARLHELYLAVHDKANFRLANPGVDYFPALAEALGDDLVLRAWSLDDALVGCSAALGRGDRFEAHMVGLDYEHNHVHGIYQNALYDFVGDAIDRRAHVLSMGRTALEIKSSIGAVPRPMTCFLRHANPLGNRLIAPLVAPLMKEISPTDWTPRSPFRDDDVAT